MKNSMKKNIVIGIVVLVVVVVVSWLYLWMQTQAYVANAAEETNKLEETITHIADRMGQNVVTDSEARQLHLRVTTHLDAVNDYPASVRVTGFSDEHRATFLDIIEKLEDLIVTHHENLSALSDQTTTTNDPLPSDAPETTSRSLPDLMKTTIHTVNGHLGAATFSYCQDDWSELKRALLC